MNATAYFTAQGSPSPDEAPSVSCPTPQGLKMVRAEILALTKLENEVWQQHICPALNHLEKYLSLPAAVLAPDQKHYQEFVIHLETALNAWTPKNNCWPNPLLCFLIGGVLREAEFIPWQLFRTGTEFAHSTLKKLSHSPQFEKIFVREVGGQLFDNLESRDGRFHKESRECLRSLFAKVNDLLVLWLSLVHMTEKLDLEKSTRDAQLALLTLLQDYFSRLYEKSPTSQLLQKVGSEGVRVAEHFKNSADPEVCLAAVSIAPIVKNMVQECRKKLPPKKHVTFDMPNKENESPGIPNSSGGRRRRRDRLRDCVRGVRHNEKQNAEG